MGEKLNKKQRDENENTLRQNVLETVTITNDREVTDLAFKSLESGLNQEEVQELYDSLHEEHRRIVRGSSRKNIEQSEKQSLISVKKELVERGAEPAKKL